MDDDVVIRVEKVYKDFILPHERVGSVKGVFTSMFQHATSKKEQQHALQDISFEVKKGEFFGIVGRNGSGKSTMLKILAGIYQPTKGKISTHGKLVPFIELGVGFNPELTGRDNVYLNGAMLGFSTKEVEAMYDEIVEFAELERFMDQKLKNYSSGMQVRLAFSMAVRSEADILLIDEVLAVGDADFQRKCFDYFRTLKRDKKTVVFVSHDMNAIREYCERAVLIEKNVMVSIGSSSEIATLYTKLFSGKAAVESDNADSNRWGETAGLIKSVDITKKLTKDTRNLKLKLRLEAKEELNHPIVGCVIKNSTGQSLMGSNTKIASIKTGEFKPGQSFIVEFSIDNIFSDGNYYVDIAVLDRDAVTVLDWWEAAAQFTVFEDSPSSYPVSPNVEIAVKRG